MTSQLSKKFLVILGPTGTGKTGLGLEVLREIEGEIISADSRQVYRGLDYTTNKINPDQSVENLDVVKHDGYWLQQGVRINLYDVVEPTEIFSVSDFVKLSLKHLDRIWTKQQLPIVVGGTGFYIDALLGVSAYSEVEPDLKLRASLEDWSLERLRARLYQSDRSVVQSMSADELNNRRRLIRYIELAERKGSVQAAREWSPLKKLISEEEVVVCKVGLNAPRDFLYSKVDQWVSHLAASPHPVNETRWLVSLAPQTDHLLRGLIYAPTAQFVNERISRSQWIGLMRGQLHRYIRSQLGWFKNEESVMWVNVSRADWRRRVAGKTKRWYDGRTSSRQ